MTQQFQPQWGPTATPAPPVPTPKKKRTGLKVIGVVVAALIMFGMGNATAKSAPAVATPAQTVTATATTTQTKTVSEVPAECKLALDEADKMMQIFADSMNIVVDVLNAASRYDVKTINASVPKLEAQTEKVKTNLYPTYRDRCRAYAR